MDLKKVCGKKFKRLCNLYNHELVHGLIEHAFMLCQFCGRGFRSRRDYQNHVIANHRDQILKPDQQQLSNKTPNSDESGLKKSKKASSSLQKLSKKIVPVIVDADSESIEKTTVSRKTKKTSHPKKRRRTDSLESAETYFTRTETVHLTEPNLSDVLGQSEMENETDVEFNVDNRNFVNSIDK